MTYKAIDKRKMVSQIHKIRGFIQINVGMVHQIEPIMFISILVERQSNPF